MAVKLRREPEAYKSYPGRQEPKQLLYDAPQDKVSNSAAFFGRDRLIAGESFIPTTSFVCALAKNLFDPKGRRFITG